MTSNNLERERRIKKIAILGAGASADAGAPVLNNFWDKVKEFIKEKKFEKTEIEKFRKILEKKDKLLPNSDIEEFFSYVDFQTKFDTLIPTPSFARSILNRVFNPQDRNCIPVITNQQKGGNEKADFIKLKKDISFLISRTLHEALKGKDDAIKNCYTKLIKDFDVTITFNWDILYEYAYKKINGESIADYPKQLGFSKLELCKPALLKLHGSLNWGGCEKCERLHISDSKIEHLIYGEGMVCPKCNGKLHPTSILPGLTKFETICKAKNPPFRNIWRCATHAITEAKEIFFFGYSLSDKDIHTKIFLRSGILNNFNCDLKVYIIDIKGEDEDFQERYKEAFGENIKLTFIEKSFKDFFSDNYFL